MTRRVGMVACSGDVIVGEWLECPRDHDLARVASLGDSKLLLYCYRCREFPRIPRLAEGYTMIRCGRVTHPEWVTLQRGLPADTQLGCGQRIAFVKLTKGAVVLIRCHNCGVDAIIDNTSGELVHCIGDREQQR